MKAVTIWQPWASMIPQGHKRYETRSWPTTYRGPLAIHAGKRLDESHIEQILASPGFEALSRARQRILVEDLTTSRYPLGAIIATCNLAACLRVDDQPAALPQPGEVEYCLGDYSPGRYAWHLTSITPLAQPVACRGAQGLWDVPAQTRIDLAIGAR